ncbi:MAG: threonine--tRNA ligase [Burkholderia sp.]|nr:threonine--tRNA ligase [Burkholderia sp.]
MLSICLPDGSVRQYKHPVTIAEVAASIDASFQKNILGGRLNDKLVDVSTVIDRDSALMILTDKDQDSLDIIRHSSAHLLAYAVKELYPDVQVVIGPVIDNGFYYDFSYQRPFTLEDLKKIEKRMHELAEKDEKVTSFIVSHDEAIEYFRNIGEKYKVEIVKSIPEIEDIKLYTHGNFTDLCRGPHVPSTGKLKIFKLMRVSGAYWRGNSKNEQLQRIYGTAWASKKDQDAYLNMLEEIEKRDHRKIGKKLDLFHMQEESPGMVFWHPKGWIIWQQIEQYIRRRMSSAGYLEIKTPIIMDRSLWEESGHWENYSENMFTMELEKREFAIKPMNCPGHIQVFKHRLRSYRDLPIRYSEFGSCHRNEPSGSLQGLMRVRSFVQDDAHIFCTEDQFISESIAFNTLAMNIYKDFGFEDIHIKLSLRPKQRSGTNNIWDVAENGLREAMIRCGLQWEELLGEGAFYGPKIEYHIKDMLGRSWQCGTLQLDMVLPKRLNAEYITNNNSRSRPVMLHRAIIGSIERFLGILIEHYAGAMPVWLSPVQVVVLNIAESQIEYANILSQTLKKQGIRISTDLRREKISYKIREHLLQKIPYLLIVGDKEQKEKKVAVRSRSSVDLGVMTVDKFVKIIQENISSLK